MSKEKQSRTVQTTGHAWDGDIQEFNNPLPTWWLWGFYATVVFAIVYWIFYPAWPMGDNYTKGIGNEIEYTTKDGKTVTTHWNTRALYERDLQEARAVSDKFAASLKDVSYADILKDADKSKYAASAAKVLFADNCAGCHQPGGAGLPGHYPSLVDDDWIWGSSYEKVEETIRKGRQGVMPGFSASLKDGQVSDVAEYVLSLSGESVDAEMVKRGQKIFHGDAGCVVSDTKTGQGNIDMGSANLTDQIWTVANINTKSDHDKKLIAVKKIINNGINRSMPAWDKRFTDTEIKILTLYVHQLGSSN